MQVLGPLLARHGKLAPLWMDTAKALRDLRRHADALHAAGRATALEAGLAGAWLLQGDLCLDLGQSEQVGRAFRQVLAIEPDNANALRGLSLALPADPEADHVRRILELVESPSIAPRDRATLHYALAHVFRRAHRADLFGRHFIEANRTQRSFTPGDRSDYETEFDALEAAFSGPLLERLPRASARSPTPIFIVGMPRSGTTLVEQLLAADPDVTAGGEVDYLRGPLRRNVERITGRPWPEAIGQLTQPAMETLAQGFAQRLGAMSGEARYVTDKTPGNFHALPLLVHLFPDAKIVHVERDPMDTCFSILQQPFSGPSPHTCDMELLAYAYARYRRLMDHWRAWRADTFLTVRYEDLVEDPVEVGRRLFDYCGLEWQAEYLDPARREGSVRTFSSSQVRQPIHPTSIGASRQFADLLALLRDALTRELG